MHEHVLVHAWVEYKSTYLDAKIVLALLSLMIWQK